MNKDAKDPSPNVKGRARRKRVNPKYMHNRVTRASTRRKAMEADLAEIENMAGDDIVGRRVKNDVFNRGVFYGTVTEYVKIDEPGEKDFWQVTYEDEDTGEAMWEVRIHHKRVFCYIESSVARTETSDGALESQW